MFEPTLFLPGLLCDAALWRPQTEALADRVAPFVADLTLDDNLPAMAARTLAAAPPRFSLAALSMGGYLAFEIWRQAPERVTRLALFATSASPDTPERAEVRRRGMQSVDAGRFVGVTSHLLPQLVHPEAVQGPVGATVKAMAKRVGGPAFLRQQRAILHRPDSRPTLAGISVPTLVVVGEDDKLTPPAQAELLHRGIAGARLVYLPRCGHLPPLERPDESTGLLRDWLDA